jgi:hypothetical protein
VQRSEPQDASPPFGPLLQVAYGALDSLGNFRRLKLRSPAPAPVSSNSSETVDRRRKQTSYSSMRNKGYVATTIIDRERSGRHSRRRHALASEDDEQDLVGSWYGTIRPRTRRSVSSTI